jgi:hypothetical protein
MVALGAGYAGLFSKEDISDLTGVPGRKHAYYEYLAARITSVSPSAHASNPIISYVRKTQRTQRTQRQGKQENER